MALSGLYLKESGTGNTINGNGNSMFNTETLPPPPIMTQLMVRGFTQDSMGCTSPGSMRHKSALTIACPGTVRERTLSDVNSLAFQVHFFLLFFFFFPFFFFHVATQFFLLFSYFWIFLFLFWSFFLVNRKILISWWSIFPLPFLSLLSLSLHVPSFYFLPLSYHISILLALNISQMYICYCTHPDGWSLPWFQLDTIHTQVLSSFSTLYFNDGWCRCARLSGTSAEKNE